jgi:DNA-binding transcriptional regulator Cro
MDYQQAIEHFGGTQNKLAAAIGTAQPVVSKWRKAGSIPPAWQFRIEVISGRKLRVDPDLIPAELRA